MVPIIVGLRKRRYPIGLHQLWCTNCRSTVTFLRVLQKTAGTFFYLPVLPLGSTRYLLCMKCHTKCGDNPALDDSPVVTSSSQLSMGGDTSTTPNLSGKNGTCSQYESDANCPLCHHPMDYIDEYNDWYCSYCDRYSSEFQ